MVGGFYLIIPVTPPNLYRAALFLLHCGISGFLSVASFILVLFGIYRRERPFWLHLIGLVLIGITYGLFNGWSLIPMTWFH